MSDCWLQDFKMNDVLRDTTTGEFVILTNGICVLPHTTTEEYKKAHATNGCRFKPYEGLVFVGPTDGLTTWSMKNIASRSFEKASDGDAAKVKEFYHKRLEEVFG